MKIEKEKRGVCIIDIYFDLPTVLANFEKICFDFSFWIIKV